MDELKCAICGKEITDSKYYAVSMLKNCNSHTDEIRADKYCCCKCFEAFEQKYDENGRPEIIVWLPPIRRKKSK